MGLKSSILCLLIVLGFTVAASSHPISTLRKVAPLPTGDDLNAIVTSGEETVIATAGSSVVVTRDLQDFEAVSTGLEQGISDFVEVGGVWFAAAGGLYRSTDLSHWEQILPMIEELPFQKVFYEGGFLFAAAFDQCVVSFLYAKLFRSEDGGLTWSEMAKAPDARCFNDVLFSKGKYFLAGLGSPLGNGLWSSVDGDVWEAEYPGPYRFLQVDEIGGEIFALHDSGGLCISPDGTTWEEVFLELRIPYQFTHKLLSIVKSATGYLIYSEPDHYWRVWHSTDGRTWDAIVGGDYLVYRSNGLNGLHRVGDMVVGYGEDGRLLKGTDWRTSPARVLPQFQDDWNAIDQSGSHVVVVGDGGQVGVSEDALGWRFYTHPSGSDLLDVAADRSTGKWFAVGRGFGDGGAILESADLVEWREVWSAPVGLRSIASDGLGGVVACGEGGTILRRSAAGVAWTQANVQGVGAATFNAVEFTDRGWFAVGDGLTVVRSSDGRNWSGSQVGEEDANLYSIAFGNGFYIVSSRSGDTAGLSGWWLSDDLENWTASDHAYSGLAFDGVHFVSPAVGVSAETGYWVGINPAPLSVRWSRSMTGGVRFRNRMIFIGTGGRIVVSDPYVDEFQVWVELMVPNVGNRAATADPDGDGLLNLTEFGLGRDPMAFDSLADLIGFRNWVRGGSGQVFHEITYPRPQPVSTAVFLEWSSDLARWHRVGAEYYSSSGTFTPGGLRGVEVSIPGPREELYWRLRSWADRSVE